MKNRRDGFLVRVIALLGILVPLSVSGQFDVRREGPNIRVQWPASIASWILESSDDLGQQSPWSIVPGEPSVAGGLRFIDLLLTGPQQYFRLRGSGGIIFVDDSNASNGNGSLADPYKTITLAEAEARNRAGTTGDAQTIYVFGGDYNESVQIDGTGVPGYDLTLMGSITQISVGGTLVGGQGEPAARVTSSSPGVPALAVTNVARFQLNGMVAVGTDGSLDTEGEAGLDGGPVVLIDNVDNAVVRASIVFGRRGGFGGDGLGGGFAGAAVNTTPSVGFDPGVANNNGSTLIDGT